VYYPVPLHLQKAYFNEIASKNQYSVTNRLVDEVISLPMHSEFSKDQIQYITTAVLDFFR